MSSNNMSFDPTSAYKRLEELDRERTSLLSQIAEYEKHSQTIKEPAYYLLQFDGGSRGNPGLCGIGYVLYNHATNTQVLTGSQVVSRKNTNNFAEYMALIVGLEEIISMNIKNIDIQGDSALILNQLNGTWNCHSQSLRPLYEKASILLKSFKSYTLEHIPRRKNAVADSLANKAMDIYLQNL